MNEDLLYRIHWTNLNSGMKATGPKMFTEPEATRLCQELNDEHPGFLHEVVHKDWVAMEERPAA